MNNKNKVSKDLIEKIISDYQVGNTIEKIRKKYCLSPNSVCKILKDNKIEVRKVGFCNRKFFPKDDCFDKIDNEKSAYFFGLMLSDGYVGKRSVGIALQASDIKIIESFKEFCYNNKEGTKIFVKKSKKTSHSDQACFSVNSVKIAKDLIKHGCCQNKTFNAEIKKNLISSRMYRHIVRGIFDGDGGISLTTPTNKKNGRPYYRIDFTGASKNLMNFVAEELDLARIPYNFRFKKNNYEGVYNIRITSREAIVDFFNYFYKDATEFIDRKFLKFCEMLIFRKRKVLDFTKKQANKDYFGVFGEKPPYKVRLNNANIAYFQDKIEAALFVNKYKKKRMKRLNPENYNWINYNQLRDFVCPVRVISDLNLKLDGDLKNILIGEYNLDI